MYSIFVVIHLQMIDMSTLNISTSFCFHNDTFPVWLQTRFAFSLDCRLLKSDPAQLFEKLETQARYVHTCLDGY